MLNFPVFIIFNRYYSTIMEDISVNNIRLVTTESCLSKDLRLFKSPESWVKTEVAFLDRKEMTTK